MLASSIVFIALFAACNAAPLHETPATQNMLSNESFLHLWRCPTVEEFRAGATIKSLPDQAVFWNNEVPVDVVLSFAKAHDRKTIRDVFPRPEWEHVIAACQTAGVDALDRMSKAYASLVSGEAWILDKPGSLSEQGATFSHYDKHWMSEFEEIRRLQRVTELYRVNLDAENQVAGKYKIWPSS
ncbi:hypothetical protein C0993_011128 [Termitomyces sp. T159_Od127]|nr:hypothetical protein C0993_011128 [Termitomyces sp. T159_Od127]